MLAYIHSELWCKNCASQAEEGDGRSRRGSQIAKAARGKHEHTWASLSAIVNDGYEESRLMKV